MPRQGNGSPVMLLWWSTAGFAALMAALAFGEYWLISIVNSPAGAPGTAPVNDLLAVALPAIPGAALSWWLAVVVSHRPSAFAGGCAGALTVVLAVLGIYLGAFFFNANMPAYITSAPVWEKLEAALYYWLFGLLYLLVQGWGWEIFLVGAVAGAFYGALVGALARRYLPSTYTDQPASTPAPDGGDS